MTGSDIFFQVSFHILPSSLTYSLFHSAGFVSHSVKYIFHTVVFVFHTVKQRILFGETKKTQEEKQIKIVPL